MQEHSVHSLIQSYISLHAIFNLHGEYLYAGTICTCTVIFTSGVNFYTMGSIFSIPQANWATVTNILTAIIEGTLINVALVEGFLYSITINFLIVKKNIK